MKQYMKLQIKRVFKLLPRLLCVLTALLIACGAVLYSLLRADGEGEDKMKVRIAISGNLDHSYLSLGLAALETLDSSRYSMEIVAMPEEEAKTSLARGAISAYIIIPDGFMEDALRGTVKPLPYVSSTGDEGISVLFKDEITRVISEYVLHAQKGVYGSADALRGMGLTEDMRDYMTRFSLEYVQLILQRSQLYRVETLGVGDSVGFSTYFLCSFIVIFLLLAALPFASLFIHRDHGVGRLLRRKGVGSLQQVSGELCALLLGILSAFFAVFVAAFVVVRLFPESFAGARISLLSFVSALPVGLLVGTMSLFLFECVQDLVSGVLLHFFTTLALCYAGGCFYPSYAFPDGMQSLARWLPTGLARAHLAACFSDGPLFLGTVLLLAFSVVFFAAALWMRRCKLTAGRG